MKRLADYEQLSRYLDVPVPTLRSWVCRKVVPHIRFTPRVVRFDLDEIDAFVASRAVGAKAGGQ